MSTLDRLDEIEARASAATEGPWYWEPPSEESFPQSDESLRSSGAKMPDARWDEVVLSGWGYDASGTSASDEDRAFIAAARTDVPALVAALRAVLALHEGRDLFGDCSRIVCLGCETVATFTEWPCKTVHAITAALDATS